MKTNLVICRNEVIIEGVNVGQFESFECKADSRTLGQTGVITIPLYAIGVDMTGRARSRTREVFVKETDGVVVNVTGPGAEAFEHLTDTTIKLQDNLVRPCAQVEVWCWYESWNAEKGENEAYDKVKVFSGFIEHVGVGFPTKIYLQDNSFILRFGTFEEVVNSDMTLKNIVERAMPIAQKGFDEERKRLGFEREIPKLTYSTEKQNVQAVTKSLDFENFGGGSPFDIVQRLTSQLCLYGGVSEDFNVYVGAGVTKNDRPLIKLDTRYNVVGRDIVPVDGRFVDYNVKVLGILKNGKRYTATGGVATSRSGESKSEFEKTYGETFRCFSSLRTADELKKFADRMLNSLKGFRNKGKITCLLYPKLTIMDWLVYTDTVFPELSSGYYVLDYEFKANDKGYFQELGVTDKVFAL